MTSPGLEGVLLFSLTLFLLSFGRFWTFLGATKNVSSAPGPHPTVSQASVSVTGLISEWRSKQGMARGWQIKTFCLFPMSVVQQV